MQGRLLVISAVEVTRDPRARRAVTAAVAAGWEVVALTGRLDGAEPLPLEGATIIRPGDAGLSRTLRSLGLGGITRSNGLVRELRGLYRLARTVRLSLLLRRAARNLGRFDVVHANELDALPTAWAVARRTNARLVYDAHEIYADSEIDAPRSYWLVAAPVERALAARADAVTTVSEPIADELMKRLRLRRRPLAVANAPELVEVPEPESHDGRLRVVYQGAMALSRPIDDLLDAVTGLDVDVTVRLAHADLDALRRDVERRQLTDNVTIADPVEPTELVQALVGHDVGVILNRPFTKNDELVFPNKLFEYMMAGLAVVAPRLPGLAPLVDGEGIGRTFEPGNPHSLREALRELAADPAATLAAKRRARELAFAKFNARAQGEILARAWTA